MKYFFTSKSIFWFSLTICTLLAIQKCWIGEDGQKWKYIISSDGRGYYAYLPAIFLFHDFTFSTVKEYDRKAFPSAEGAAGFLLEEDNIKVNKYFPGLAVLWLPFFLIAWLLSFLTGEELNGYSFYFQIMVSAAAIFYVFLGLWFTRKLLLIEKIPDKIIAVVILVMLFGTNLYYYSVVQPALSHAYSFSLVTGFLLMTKRSILHFNKKNLLLAAFFLGFNILVRPVNAAIILAAPLLAESYRDFFSFLQRTIRTPKIVASFILVTVLPVALIPLILFMQTGNPFYWPYRGEGFYFNDPQICNALFSYRKGLFVYTPVCFVALIGLFPVFVKSHFRFISFIALLTSVIYIYSSWWQWYFGDSFGYRALIDFYPVFALLLSILLASIRKTLFKASLVLTLFILVFLNQVQAYQYEHFIMHHDMMSEEKYWYTFLKTGKQYQYSLSGNKDAPLYGKLLNFKQFFNDFERDYPYWNSEATLKTADAYEGSYSASFNEKLEYGTSLSLKMDSSWMTTRQMFVTASLWKKELVKNACSKANLVVTTKDTAGNILSWKGFPLNELPSEDEDINVWKNAEWQFYFPAQIAPGNTLEFYIWNPSQKSFLLDNLEIRFFKALPRNSTVGINSELMR